MDRLRVFAAMAVVVLACIALRVTALPTVETPRHDDVISYLAATGHLAEYTAIIDSRAPPFGHWANAGDWQRLWSIDDPFCFERIASDLGLHDIHPPLYFWLLHLWLVAFGVTAYSGPTLNLLLSVGTLFLIYSLARSVSGSPAAGVAAALVWGSSRAAIAITMAARQYELLGLLAVAFVWQLLLISDPARKPAIRESYLLAGTAAAGFLTHYHFALLAAAGAAAAWCRLYRSSLRRRLTVLAPFAAGLLLPLLVHPYLLGSFRRSEDPELFEWATAPKRAARVFGSMVEFGGFGSEIKAIWVLSLVAAAATLVWPPGAAHRSESLRGSSSIWSLLVITAMLGGATAVLYVSMVSPRHATTWRHLAMLWPLLAVLVASLLWQRAFGRGLASVLCVALVAASLSGIRSDRRVEWPAVVPDPRRPVLLDRSAHGVLPRVLWYATPGTRVFAAKQSYLLDHPAEWLDTLGDEPIYAATAIQFGTTQEARDRLLALFRTRYLEDGDRRRSPNAEWIGWRRIGSRPPPASPRSDR